MNAKDNKYLVSDAKTLNKTTFVSSNLKKYPTSAVVSTSATKAVNNNINSTKDAKQAFFSSSATSSATSSTSKYQESNKKTFISTSKVTTSSWTTSASAAAESKSFLKTTSPVSKYPPVENKYNSYSSINKDSPLTPTNSIFYSFDKSVSRPFGNDIHTNKYVSPYRGQAAHQNPLAGKSDSEIAKWSELKTNPALYKKPTANVNSIQKPLGSLLLTTAAATAIHKNGIDPGLPKVVTIDPRVKASVNNNVPSSLTTSVLTRTPYISTFNGKSKKGYLVIYNQEEFKDKTMNRQGSRRDEEALCRTFFNFGMDPKVERNLKYNDIQSRVLKLSKKDFKDYGVFVAVFLSHGDKEEIIFSYDKPFNINHSFIHPIARNPSLNGKPKIFIIAACKGDQKNVLPEERIYETDSVPFQEGRKPYMSELLKCYSTYEGYVSYRDPTKGTVFIQTLCDVLSKQGDKLSIEDILKEVNKSLTEGPYTNKQVPTVVSTMSGHFCFGDLKKK